MFRKLIATDTVAGPAVARTVLGLVMFPHGAQHALGWFGGYGFAGTVGWMSGTLGIPAPIIGSLAGGAIGAFLAVRKNQRVAGRPY